MGKALAVGEVERWYGAVCWRVGWNWPVAWTAAVVAPGEVGPVLVVMVRVAPGVVVLVVVVDVGCEGEGECVYAAAPAAAAAEVDEAAFCMADWARKAERNPEKKGLLVVMVVSEVVWLLCEVCWRSLCMEYCTFAKALG